MTAGKCLLGGGGAVRIYQGLVVVCVILKTDTKWLCLPHFLQYGISNLDFCDVCHIFVEISREGVVGGKWRIV